MRCIKVKGNKSPYDGDRTYWSSRTGKHLGVNKEVAKTTEKSEKQMGILWIEFQANDINRS